MTTPESAKAGRIDVRKVWPLETDFTTWLAENMDLLSKVVDLQLQLVQEETWLTGWPEWTGRVDILARIAESGDYVVIENQMEPSDNEHLAGVLNYASHSDSRILILVTSEITAWHRRTMDWLNEGNGIRIYGVEMSAWCNGDAIERHLKLVAGPNLRTEWPGFQFPPYRQKYLDFFRPLVAELHKQGIADRGVPRASNDQSFPSGFQDVTYHAGFWSGPAASVYLWIATWDADFNKRVFDALGKCREKIDGELSGLVVEPGGRILWDRRDNMRMSAVIVTRTGSIDDPQEQLDEFGEWMLKTLPKFKDVIGPHLEAVVAELEGERRVE